MICLACLTAKNPSAKPIFEHRDANPVLKITKRSDAPIARIIFLSMECILPFYSNACILNI